MKISTAIHAAVPGLCVVEVSFIGDDGEEEVRPPISTLVEDKGGSGTVRRAGLMKLRDELPAEETEVRALLTTALDEP